MLSSSGMIGLRREAGLFVSWGIFWLALAMVGAAIFFSYGAEALLKAWSKPEYSHGPLIPVLSLLMLLKLLKDVPIREDEHTARWPGVLVMMLGVFVGFLGNLANIADLSAYAIIIWTFGVLLVSFGWRTGVLLWPPVLHLVYMLPLPGTIYYKISTYLQFISSELGVYFLRVINVPVFLEGNIIDLGVFKLHVAEACSGLRYLFPIMSFSYIFAVLYRGPVWHKAVLLLSAVPITIVMNSVRIAVAGYIVNRFGVEYVEGFSHFFEGWVIFVCCIIILFALAWLMLRLRQDRTSLADALDLDTDGLGAQAMRLRLIEPSRALILGACVTLAAAISWELAPDRDTAPLVRERFTTFPTTLGDWQSSAPHQLDRNIEIALGADDYYQVDLFSEQESQPVGLFMAWYADQSQGGVHSPEICLPASGWEIAWLERSEISQVIDYPEPFNINRAIIQKGETRMLVYYWFEQRGRKVAWDVAAKFHLLMDGIRTGQTDGAIVRLTTPIQPGESDAAAEARLHSALVDVMEPLPRFLPEG